MILANCASQRTRDSFSTQYQASVRDCYIERQIVWASWYRIAFDNGDAGKRTVKTAGVKRDQHGGFAYARRAQNCEPYKQRAEGISKSRKTDIFARAGSASGESRVPKASVVGRTKQEASMTTSKVSDRGEGELGCAGLYSAPGITTPPAYRMTADIRRAEKRAR